MMAKSSIAVDITSPDSSKSEEKAVIAAMNKAWKKQYLASSNFPDWTRGQTAITEPLKLPEYDKNRLANHGLDEDVKCLFCEASYDLPSKQKEFVAHLVEFHHFMIDQPHMISDLASYVKYWSKKFEERPMSEFCSVLTSKVISKDSKEEEKEVDFHMLSDVLREDRELRILLQRRRLEEILDYHRIEREDKSFKRDCLFCRTTFEGDFSKLLNHMAFDHNFSVGKPDNIVFVNELIDLLDKNLNDNICIFCEKTFKTRDVLKEHMRKKGHKKINPKNANYDKFYVVNYQEFGRKWDEIARDKDGNFSEDELPTGFESDSDDTEDGEWGDWMGDRGCAVCLFCPAKYSALNDLLTHMTSIHDFDFQDVRNGLRLSFYRQIKLVNYIRRKMHLNECFYCGDEFDSTEDLTAHLESEAHMKVPEDAASTWDKADYYFPTYENDELLYRLDDELFGKDEEDEAPVEGEDATELKLEESVLNDPGLVASIIPGGRGSGAGTRSRRGRHK